MLIVSHDRRLLESVCERLWVVEPGSGGQPGRAAPFDGGYRDWRAAVTDGWTVAGELETQAKRLDGRPTRTSAGREPSDGRPPTPEASERTGSAGTADAGQARPRSSPRPTPLSKDAYLRQKALVEGDLDRLGQRKSHLELQLGSRAVQANFVELRRLTSELADVDAALAQAEDAWLALSERAPK